MGPIVLCLKRCALGHVRRLQAHLAAFMIDNLQAGANRWYFNCELVMDVLWAEHKSNLLECRALFPSPSLHMKKYTDI